MLKFVCRLLGSSVIISSGLMSLGLFTSISRSSPKSRRHTMGSMGKLGVVGQGIGVECTDIVPIRAHHAIETVGGWERARTTAKNFSKTGTPSVSLSVNRG